MYQNKRQVHVSDWFSQHMDVWFNAQQSHPNMLDYIPLLMEQSSSDNEQIASVRKRF